MDAKRFATGYPRNVPLSAYREDPLLPDRFDEGRRWMSSYSRMLHDRLDGKVVHLDDLAGFSQAYTSWNHRFVDQVTQHMHRIAATATEYSDDSDPEPDPPGTTGLGQAHPEVETLDPELITERHMATVTFEPWQHRLLGYTQDMWAAALTNTPVPRELMIRSAINIATSGTDVWVLRDSLHDENAFFTEDNRFLRAITTGMLAELDVIVLLLMISLRHPQLIPLPAPPEFEQWAGNRNVDFIVLDISTDQVIGIQCKASSAGTQDLKVDPDRVMVIDTSLDLFDALAKRTHELSSSQRVVAWPGMVAAHYVLSVKPPRPPWPWLDQTLLYRSKIRSQRIAHEARNRNDEARRILEDRLLRALGAT